MKFNWWSLIPITLLIIVILSMILMLSSISRVQEITKEYTCVDKRLGYTRNGEVVNYLILQDDEGKIFEKPVSVETYYSAGNKVHFKEIYDPTTEEQWHRFYKYLIIFVVSLIAWIITAIKIPFEKL